MAVCTLFIVKRKTAYEMRISDWSSDVCSSDVGEGERQAEQTGQAGAVGARAEQPDGGLVAERRHRGDRAVGVVVGEGAVEEGEELAEQRWQVGLALAHAPAQGGRGALVGAGRPADARGGGARGPRERK